MTTLAWIGALIMLGAVGFGIWSIWSDVDEIYEAADRLGDDQW